MAENKASMDNNHKKMTSGILPNVNKVNSVEGVKAFSRLCEDTCSNLFAYSPFLLNIDSEEFLQFQQMADELKKRIHDGETSLGVLCNLCARINKVYERLISSCWNAFVEDANLERDPGKFIVQQLLVVKVFTNSIN